MASDLSVGVDIGFTNIRAGVVNEDGALLGQWRGRTNVAGGAEGVLEQVKGAVAELAGRHPEVEAVGIGIAGQCDIIRGSVRCGPNLFWPDVPFQRMVAEATELRAIMRNDVVMATVGEWRHGAGRGVDDLVGLFVGTGIGGGAVIDGTLLEGSTGCGGHFGHVSVQQDGPLCTCGRPGCIEAYAGGWGVAKLAQEALAKDPAASTFLHALSGGRVEIIDSRMVADAAHKGDRLALSIRDSMASALSSGLASVINSFNPRRVVLGGPVLTGFPQLFDMVRERALRLSLKSAVIDLEIVPSALGDMAGVIGAATMALEKR
jgi:glucokinase